MEKIRSPFDVNQIASINALQSDPRFNASQCKNCTVALIAIEAGLFCPSCEQVVMSWAWDFMTNWTWIDTLESTRRILGRELSHKDRKYNEDF
jgi:uncharacterized Zn finger protein (UPF0148 family)